jgi:hypothetical protein
VAIPVTFQLASFPDGFCWQTAQQYANAIVAALSGFIGGNFNGVIIGANSPQLTDQDKLWVRTDANGRPLGIFLYQGTWLWPHPIEPSSPERRIWVGSEADLWSYDGGDGTNPTSTAPTATSGAMWQRDTDFDFKLPIGAGTNPVTYDGNPGTVIAIGGTAGEERHTMLINESGPHKHWICSDDTITGVTAGPTDMTNAQTLAGRVSHAGDGAALFQAAGNGTTANIGLTSNPTVATVSHQNLPPVKGVLFIKRTSRQFITAT